MSEEYQRFLESKGVSLNRVGTDEIGFDRTDALEAIEILRRHSVPILGGDVYFKRGSKVESAYANWYVEPHESAGSWEMSRKYIQCFPERTDVTPLFVLVPKS